MAEFECKTVLNSTRDKVFAWYTHPGSIERLIPPWERIKVLERPERISDGVKVAVLIHKGCFSQRWVALHRDVKERVGFSMEQIEGPYARWIHSHTFNAQTEDSCELSDKISFEIPKGIMGYFLSEARTKAMLVRFFNFQYKRIREDLLRHAITQSYPSQRIIISGATGLVGTALTAFLRAGGHTVLQLSRRKATPGSLSIFWDPLQGHIDKQALEGADAVIHLAGENLASSRWTQQQKGVILRSRTEGTRLLSEALAELERPPRVMISASAVGFYGNRGDQLVSETSYSGAGFLADVCQAWETASVPASKAGIRLVNLRIGPVVSGRGGMLERMLPLYKLGLGGKLGLGDQYISWIALDDLIGMMHHILFNEAITGPVNAVAPHPVTNANFTKILGSVLGKFTPFTVPSLAIRSLLGEMGSEVLLSSTRVSSEKIQSSGFSFFYPTLEEALRMELGYLKE